MALEKIGEFIDVKDFYKAINEEKFHCFSLGYALNKIKKVGKKREEKLLLELRKFTNYMMNEFGWESYLIRCGTIMTGRIQRIKVFPLCYLKHVEKFLKIRSRANINNFEDALNIYLAGLSKHGPGMVGMVTFVMKLMR